jgi:hypothetical protein
MTNDLKITCPKCKETFDAADAFNAHYKNTQIENDKRIKEVQKIAAEEAEKKFKSQIENQKLESEKFKQEAQKKATEEAEKKFKSQIENQKQESEKFKQEAILIADKKAAEKYKLQSEDKDKQIEKIKKEQEAKVKEELEKQIEQTKKETVLKAEEQAEKKYKAIVEKEKEEKEILKKSQEITQRRLEERTQEINQIMQDRKVELQGEAQEERIQDYLRKIFPEDDVEEIKKGARGGDCILTINYKGKKNIAKIYFESKDTKVFQEKWVDKLLNDMKDKGIANGIIIVSKSALPPDFDELGGYVERYGNTITIIPLVFPVIHAIVSKIRSILILKSRENNNHQVPQLMQKAWDNLQSPNFILPVKSMLSQINAMETLLKKDKESFQRSSAHKDRTIKEINDNIITMINSFYTNVGDIFPQDLLSNDNDLLEEDLSPKKIEQKSEILHQNIEEVKIINSDFSDEFMNLLKTNIHKEWSLSIRTISALKDLGIIYIGDLITYTETDLLRARNFGQKSLDEIKDCMNQYSLSFGTVIKDWEIIRSELI